MSVSFMNFCVSFCHFSEQLVVTTHCHRITETINAKPCRVLFFFTSYYVCRQHVFFLTWTCKELAEKSDTDISQVKPKIKDILQNYTKSAVFSYYCSYNIKMLLIRTLIHQWWWSNIVLYKNLTLTGVCCISTFTFVSLSTSYSYYLCSGNLL